MPKADGPFEVFWAHPDVVVIFDGRIELPISIYMFTKSQAPNYKPVNPNSNGNDGRSQSIASEPIFDSTDRTRTNEIESGSDCSTPQSVDVTLSISHSNRKPYTYICQLTDGTLLAEILQQRIDPKFLTYYWESVFTNSNTTKPHLRRRVRPRQVVGFKQLFYIRIHRTATSMKDNNNYVLFHQYQWNMK